MAERKCSVDGCTKPLSCKGYCNTHYHRVKRHGSPHITKREYACKITNDEKLDWIRLSVECDPFCCLRWPWSIGPRGYASVCFGGRMVTVNRVIAIIRGDDMDSLDAAHECGNRWCVSPRHIVMKTRSENMLDKLRHGTMTNGEKCPSSKLTEDQVIYIIKSSKRGVSLARELGVSQMTISDIRRGATWHHLPR